MASDSFLQYKRGRKVRVIDCRYEKQMKHVGKEYGMYERDR